LSYILALDEGTTQVKAGLVDKNGQIIAKAETGISIKCPAPGLVEQNAEEIFQAAVQVIQNIIQKTNINPKEIKSLGIANQRDTITVWDRKTGKPLYNSLVWQDHRGEEIQKEIYKCGWNDIITQKTGSTILPLSNLIWLIRNVPQIRNRINSGELLFGGIDSWLLWKFTNGKIHATDYSNASLTSAYNIYNFEWDSEILSKFGIPKDILPNVYDSSHNYGFISIPEIPLKCPIGSLVGDQHAALFGHLCLEPGTVKVTYGTGSFLMINVGKSQAPVPPGIIKHIAWSLNENPIYTLSGLNFCSGSAVQWLQEGLGMINSPDMIENLAEKVDNSGGVFFVPALTGLGAPEWDDSARGLLIGLTRGNRPEHIARAVLESLAFQVRDVIDAAKGILKDIKYLRVDGKPTKNNLLMQLQANLCNVPVERALQYDVTLRGAAFLAGLTTDFWSSVEEIKALPLEYYTFKPKRNMDNKYLKWKEAVKRACSWET